MSEHDWLTSTDPAALLTLLRERGPVSERQLRLLACAICRLPEVWELLPDLRCRQAVEVAERFADGEATGGELLQAHAGAARAALNGTIQFAAAWASHCVVNYDILDHILTSDRGWQPEHRPAQTDLIRAIFGNPLRSVTLDPRHIAPTVRAIAHHVYADRAWSELPILADALREAGIGEEHPLLRGLLGWERCPNCLEADFALSDFGGPMMGGKEPYASRAKKYWHGKCACAGIGWVRPKCRECSGGYKYTPPPSLKAGEEWYAPWKCPTCRGTGERPPVRCRGMWELDLILGKS